MYLTNNNIFVTVSIKNNYSDNIAFRFRILKVKKKKKNRYHFNGKNFKQTMDCTCKTFNVLLMV